MRGARHGGAGGGGGRPATGQAESKAPSLLTSLASQGKRPACLPAAVLRPPLLSGAVKTTLPSAGQMHLLSLRTSNEPLDSAEF